MLLETQCAVCPAHLLSRLAVMLTLCAGASANCSLRNLAALLEKLYHRAKGTLAVWIHYIVLGCIVKTRPDCKSVFFFPRL